MFEKKISCKNCKKDFVVKYHYKDQSSIASCNKQYCSASCKKEFLLYNGTKNSIELQCEKCDRTYYKPPSLSKNSRFCSRTCANLKYANDNRLERKSLSCKECGKLFEVIVTSKRKFCGTKCLHKSKKTIERVEYRCEVCGELFPGLETDPRRFCTRRCQYAGQSAGLVKLSTNGRSGVRIDLPQNMRFKSSLEADYARFCVYTNKKFRYECKTFTVKMPSGKIRRYTPDFYHPDEDVYVETKARRKDKKYESNLDALFILEQEGYNVRVVYMNEFYENLREADLYEAIPNLERRNYKKTKCLIVQDD